VRSQQLVLGYVVAHDSVNDLVLNHERHHLAYKDINKDEGGEELDPAELGHFDKGRHVQNLRTPHGQHAPHVDQGPHPGFDIRRFPDKTQAKNNKPCTCSRAGIRARLHECVEWCDGVIVSPTDLFWRDGHVQSDGELARGEARRRLDLPHARRRIQSNGVVERRNLREAALRQVIARQCPGRGLLSGLLASMQ
jgi:hypothetical protein